MKYLWLSVCQNCLVSYPKSYHIYKVSYIFVVPIFDLLLFKKLAFIYLWSFILVNLRWRMILYIQYWPDNAFPKITRKNKNTFVIKLNFLCTAHGSLSENIWLLRMFYPNKMPITVAKWHISVKYVSLVQIWLPLRF